MIENWPEKTQIILCSATIDKGVQQLAKQQLNDPIFIKADDKLDVDGNVVERLDVDGVVVDQGISFF
jgi:superfamily II DNA/RNA helicase